VVSPGHEADGIIHMPGGQSGHPLSEFWGAGHDDWVRGRATPFLPGAAQYTLRLQPAHLAPPHPVQTNAARAADKGEQQ
jgi:penicillin amidase